MIPNVPDQGRWVLARVSGPYSYSIAKDASPEGEDYGHIVEVVPIRRKDGKIAVVEPDNKHVDARLRATMRNMSRMWSIDTLGPAGRRQLHTPISDNYISPSTTSPDCPWW